MPDNKSKILEQLLKLKAQISSLEEILKEAESTNVQPTYIDSKGEVFTATRIMTSDFRPSGKIKAYSLSERVNSPDFGAPKKQKKKKKTKSKSKKK